MSTRSNKENIQQFSDSNEDDLIDIEIDRKGIEDAIDELIGQQIFLKSLLENEDMGLIEGAPDSVSIWSKAIGITR